MTQYLISCKESRIEHNRSFYGSFLLGPFENGQSLTIANALRRTLISELKGIAIVSIQIEGVLHEYSSLPGIKDSVLDILLNIKEIVFKKVMPVQSTEKGKRKPRACGSLGFYPQIGYLRARGPGVVRASDFKLPPFIQLVDPDQYIATLEEDGFLNMKFQISEGQNYIIKQPSSKTKNNQKSTSSNMNLRSYKEKRHFLLTKIQNLSGLAEYKLLNKKRSNPLKMERNIGDFTSSNTLELDAVFAPVTKVNYIIENSEHKLVENSFLYSEELNELFKFIKPLKDSPFLDKSKEQKVDIGELSNVPFQLKKENVLYLEKLKKKTKSTNFDTTQILEILEIKKQLSLMKTSPDFGIKRSGKQNIVIEIWTNGSLHPKEALYQAIHRLIQVFSKLYLVPDNILTYNLNSQSNNTSSNLPNFINNNVLTKKSPIAPLNTKQFSSNYTIFSTVPLKKVNSSVFMKEYSGGEGN
jgi:DNA-directed RNA polymerase alpha subunit